MPDKAGAFLKASEIISENGGNIIRVSYNKAVDIHTLFIDVSGKKEQLDRISDELMELGYLANQEDENKVILIVLKLYDVPGAVKPVLDILNHYKINISYMNSQENGTGYQYFKMGLLIEDTRVIKNLLDEISKICDVKILEYDVTEKVLDGTVFYLSFANEMRNLLTLSQSQTNEVIIYSNKIMQMLDERNEAPLKTFEYIRKFAKFIVEHKGEKFHVITNQRRISDKVVLHLIEPPCGSNICILESSEELLFIDGGFSSFKEEMLVVLNGMFHDFDQRKKNMVLTHADIDHTGLVSLFDTIYVNQDCYENFMLECDGKDNFREQNDLHAPYCKLSRIISGYEAPDLRKFKNFENNQALLENDIKSQNEKSENLNRVGTLTFCDLQFDVYEGNGGHVKGETVLVCKEQRIVFTGDVLVNIKGFSKEQQEFNQLAPYLMTSVNMDSEKAKLCRDEVLNRFAGYTICPGHGPWFQI